MADEPPMRDAARSTHLRLVGTEPGDVVGGYELLREIGRGGMAEVWVARRAKAATGKFVALKLVLPQYVGDSRYAGMFRSEAEVSAPLSHGNIVQVFDEGEDHGRSYLVMEWVDGVDLSRLMADIARLQQRDAYLRLRVAAYIIGQVLHGLSYAHKVISHRGAQLGIVHRDISPQNILVSVSGDVKVADFGIAHRMTEETAGVHVKGKLRYMAPEQLGGSSHAPTVDLYAVGAMLHELLDGRKFRHDADDQLGLYRQVIAGVVPALGVEGVPPELDAMRVALLQPDPKHRPQTADSALLMLKRWAGYSEMRVELATICGLATGVVRPRTGPLIEAGQPTIPPSARAPKPAVAVHAEPDAPCAPWGSPPPTDHSSTDVLEPSGTAPIAEATVSRVHIAMRPAPVNSRGWMLAAAFALLAAAGAGTTAWLVRDSAPVVSTRAAAPEIARDDVVAQVVPVPPKAEPVSGPVFDAEPATVEIAVTAREPDPPVTADPPAASVPVAQTVAPPPVRTVRKAKPIASSKPAVDPPVGPEVIVRFRLEGGLDRAEVKLGNKLFVVWPRYDARVVAGRYAARWRPTPADPWRSAGKVVIGDSGEWKLMVSPKGVRVSKL